MPDSKSNIGKILLTIGRIALAAIFIVAAYAKLKPQAPVPWSMGSMRFSLSMFAMQVDSYQLLPVFFAGMVRSYFLGLEINCGCFGPGERLGPMTLLRDGSLLALALAVTVGAFLINRRSNTPDPALAKSSAAIP